MSLNFSPPNHNPEPVFVVEATTQAEVDKFLGDPKVLRLFIKVPKGETIVMNRKLQTNHEQLVTVSGSGKVLLNGGKIHAVIGGGNVTVPADGADEAYIDRVYDGGVVEAVHLTQIGELGAGGVVRNVNDHSNIVSNEGGTVGNVDPSSVVGSITGGGQVFMNEGEMGTVSSGSVIHVNQGKIYEVLLGGEVRINQGVIFSLSGKIVYNQSVVNSKTRAGEIVFDTPGRVQVKDNPFFNE